MSLLSLSNVSFGYACGATLFAGASFSIDPDDRVALAGPNGAGKSTLLGLIAGELDPISGEIARRRGLTIAAAGQETDLDVPRTLFEFTFAVRPVLAGLRNQIRHFEEQRSAAVSPIDYAALVNEYQKLSGYAAEADVERILSGLGFASSELSREVQSLSGGERMRAQLARALATPADLLILDEPTNHLDRQARDWLGDALRIRAGACVVASHDRALLAQFAERFIEIERGIVRVFEGDYDNYRRARALIEDQAWAAYEAFERRKAAMELASQRREALAARVVQTPAGIRGGKDHYARKAAKVARTARILRERTDEERSADKPWEEPSIASLSFDRVPRSSDLVLVAEHLMKAYGSRILFRDLSFHLRRGGRLVIRGANGSGKTTLLNIVNGAVQPDAGLLRFGAHVQPATIAQDLSAGEMQLSPLDLCGGDTTARTLLACVRLRPECLNRPLAELSGGERTKVALARILNSGANLLLLDEPTNHLEIEAQEALEKALRLYPGALIAVSHNPFFIEAIGPEADFVDL